MFEVEPIDEKTPPKLRPNMIFTGDCLFEGGVGKFFEGSPRMMHSILKELLLEPERDPSLTTMFYGHDYGWKNMKWVKEVIFAPENIKSKTHPDILEL